VTIIEIIDIEYARAPLSEHRKSQLVMPISLFAKLKWQKSKSVSRKNPTPFSPSLPDLQTTTCARAVGDFSTAARARNSPAIVPESAACRDQGGAIRARAGAERSRKSFSRSTEIPFPIPRDENAFQFLATSVLQTVIAGLWLVQLREKSLLTISTTKGTVLRPLSRELA
jgi:hypothetical protein